MLLTNAVLTKIETPGPLTDEGDPGTPVAAWTGRAAGYLKRVARQEVSGGEQITVKEDVFILLRSTGAPIVETAGPDWEATTVVIEDRRTPTPVTRRFTVDGMENRAAGTPVDSIRLQLANERASA